MFDRRKPVIPQHQKKLRNYCHLSTTQIHKRDLCTEIHIENAREFGMGRGRGGGGSGDTVTRGRGIQISDAGVSLGFDSIQTERMEYKLRRSRSRNLNCSGILLMLVYKS